MEREIIRRRLQKPRVGKIIDEIRRLICEKYDKNESFRSISDSLNVNYQSVASIIKIYKANGRIESLKSHSGRRTKLSDEDKTFILSQISEDCSVTLNALKIKILNARNINVSKSTLCRTLLDFHYSFKRVSFIPERRNTLDTIEKRYQYATVAINMSPQKTFYLDEMGVSFVMRCAHGRARIGQTPRKTVAAIKSRNISVSAAMGFNGVVLHKAQNVAFNSNNYCNFLTELCDKLLRDGIQNAIFVLDNVAFHKTTSVQELIISRGHTAVFLPPYSPQLNPIEEVFSKWKNLVRQKNCVNEAELLRYIPECANEISCDDITGYYSHMRGYLLKAIIRKEF